MRYRAMTQHFLIFSDKSGARQREANLCGADLSQAYIADAMFDDADLRHADLRWVRGLESASFFGASYCPDTTLLPEGLDPDAYLMQAECAPCEADATVPDAPSVLIVS
jgi:uncharacterized protein YjbI with pentapeptide repeats